MRETELYGPVKVFLEDQCYEVKGEVGAADVVAVRGAEPPVIVELKVAFSLTLFHQAVARQAISELVYVAVARKTGRGGLRALKDNVALARRLGLGVITVRPRDGFVEVHCDPGPYRPRKSPARAGRLLREFARRVGDPTNGGATRKGLVTAYRQDALRCLGVLADGEPRKGAEVARATGVPAATRLMRDDHYGWFERAGTGVYRITPKGAEALKTWAGEIAALARAAE